MIGSSDTLGTELLARLHEIDSRPNKSVRLVSSDAATWNPDTYQAWVHVGSEPLNVPGLTPISVGCTGWKAWLARGVLEFDVVSADMPFGAITAACFGTAEVFKSLLARVADDVSLQERFHTCIVQYVPY